MDGRRFLCSSVYQKNAKFAAASEVIFISRAESPQLFSFLSVRSYI